MDNFTRLIIIMLIAGAPVILAWLYEDNIIK
jgi:hypothetical protein